MTRIIIIACFSFILLNTNTFAQNNDSLDDTIKSLSTDLAKLQIEIENTYKQYQLDQEKLKSGVINTNAVVVTKDKSPLFAGADNSSSVVSQAKAGEIFQVIDKANGWYAIKTDESPMTITTAWLDSANAAPTNKSFTDKLIDKIFRTAQDLKEQYKNNKYIKITGYSVEIGLPPSLNVSFELKE